jgi:hypothetical protein
MALCNFKCSSSWTVYRTYRPEEKYLAAVGFVEHFVSSSGIKMMREIRDTRPLIATHQNTNSFEPLANGIFTT